MTIYQQLQNEILRWDEAVSEQSEQLVLAATQMAAHFPKYLGAESDAVRLGVGSQDGFDPRELDESDCLPDGAGVLNFSLRLRVLPTGRSDYIWDYDVEIRLSISGDKFHFSTMSGMGNPKHSASITPGAVQTGAFAPVYEAIVRTVKDDFDSRKVKRIG